MKTFVPALVVAFAGAASAQGLADLPQCALQCFITALGGDGCDLTDFACHCRSADQLFASVTPCVQSACSAEDQAAVISGVESTCASAGVTISVPEPSATAAPSSSAAESSSEASSALPTSSASQESSAPTAAPTSSYDTAPSSSVSGSPTPSASSNGTIPTSATPSPSASEFPGAASRVGQAAGLVGAAAFAFFAL